MSTYLLPDPLMLPLRAWLREVEPGHLSTTLRSSKLGFHPDSVAWVESCEWSPEPRVVRSVDVLRLVAAVDSGEHHLSPAWRRCTARCDADTSGFWDWNADNDYRHVLLGVQAEIRAMSFAPVIEREWYGVRKVRVPEEGL